MTTLIIEDVGGPDIVSEPLSLDDVKLHLKVEHTVDDTLIAALMVAAREEAEHLTGRLYAAAERTTTLDAFPVAEIRLSYSPLTSVETITYFDGDGVEQDFTDFAVSAGSPGFVFPAPGFSWPSTQTRPGAVTISYTAGMAPEDVPEIVKAWMKLKIGALYANREAWTLGKAIEQNPFIDRLLDRERLYFVA